MWWYQCVMSWRCVFRGGAPGSEAEDSAGDRSASGGADGDLRSDQSWRPSQRPQSSAAQTQVHVQNTSICPFICPYIHHSSVYLSIHSSVNGDIYLSIHHSLIKRISNILRAPLLRHRFMSIIHLPVQSIIHLLIDQTYIYLSIHHSSILPYIQRESCCSNTGIGPNYICLSIHPLIYPSTAAQERNRNISL